MTTPLSDHHMCGFERRVLNAPLAPTPELEAMWERDWLDIHVTMMLIVHPLLLES